MSTTLDVATLQKSGGAAEIAILSIDTSTLPLDAAALSMCPHRLESSDPFVVSVRGSHTAWQGFDPWYASSFRFASAENSTSRLSPEVLVETCRVGSSYSSTVLIQGLGLAGRSDWFWLQPYLSDEVDETGDVRTEEVDSGNRSGMFFDDRGDAFSIALMHVSTPEDLESEGFPFYSLSEESDGAQEALKLLLGAKLSGRALSSG